MKIKFQSLKTKLIILCLSILIVPSVIIGFSAYQISKSNLDTAGEAQLKNNVKMVIGQINILNKQVEAGNLTEKQAQEMLRQELLGKKDAKNQRSIKKEYTVGDTGYAFAVNKKAVSVMNPLTEGQDISNLKTEDGVMLGKEIVKLGENGGGFLKYKWETPAKTIESKVSYFEMDPHWGWIVGCGAYESEFNTGATEVLNIVLIVSVISIIIGLIVILFFSTRLVNPIIVIGKGLNKVAQGDLTIEHINIKTKDEVGQLAKDFVNMKEQMTQLILQVKTSAEQVAASSEELTASSQETSRATEEITQSIQKVAAGSEQSTENLEDSSKSLEEVSAGIQMIAENSSSIAESGLHTTELAKQGGHFVEETVNQINLINKSVNETGEVIRLLDRRSQEIGDITNVISDIANQTNLLALNAAIEAARAGEHGKGFAVVADEVRKLAEQSQLSSTQISNLIKEIQKDMNLSNDSMEQVKKDVQGGLGIIGKTQHNFEEILSSMENMSGKIDEMAATAQQMSAGAQEVSATVTGITAISKQSSMASQGVAAATEEQLASMEEISASANHLSEMASHLQEIVGEFKISQ
ncbi:methyl-accepting chemotaxis protein [Bacillus sp. T33-2]|nr:methyl-accepting chemotaxis protein [Bacillus sp. T33-2]PLR99051.1 methyl-accepting chemotaxis protein [Bacillus sp. T33-2]